MNDESIELPEAAERRLHRSAFSSGLSVADFAACLNMGLEPVGFVQGFCAMQWSAYAGNGLLQRGVSPSAATGNGYLENYQCPHGMISAEHRLWGQNYQQPWIEKSWHEGFAQAYSRMLEETRSLGAHAVIGVVDTVGQLSDLGVIEFRLRGTAVKVGDVPAPSSAPWTTYLAGQRLAKVFEAGYVPVAIVAVVSSIRVWAYCVTQYLMEGGGFALQSGATSSVEIAQLVSARSSARDIVRAYAREQLDGDSLHGVELLIRERDFQQGDVEIQSVLRGNRLRRFKDFDALAPPRPTVRLS